MFDPTKSFITDSLPGRRGVVVTPDDDNDLPQGPVRALVTGSAGDVSFLPLDNADNEPLTLTGLTAGAIIPYITRRVLEATTAVVLTVEFD